MSKKRVLKNSDYYRTMVDYVERTHLINIHMGNQPTEVPNSFSQKHFPTVLKINEKIGEFQNGIKESVHRVIASVDNDILKHLDTATRIKCALLDIRGSDTMELLMNLNKKQQMLAIQRLIAVGRGNEVVKNIIFVDKSLQKVVTEQLIAAKVYKNIMYPLKFIDKEQRLPVIKHIITEGYGNMVVDGFQYVDKEEQMSVIERLDTTDIIYVLRYLDKEQQMSLIKHMIAERYGLYLIEKGIAKVYPTESRILVVEGLITAGYFPKGMKAEQIMDIFAAPGMGQRTINGLYMLHTNFPQSTYKDHAKPILDSQGEGSFQILRGTDRYKNFLPLDFVVGIAKRAKTQAYAFIEELALPLSEEKSYDLSLEGEQKYFYQYLQEIGIVSTQLYKKYGTLCEEKDEILRIEGIIELKNKISHLQNQILEGHIEEQPSKDELLYTDLLKKKFSLTRRPRPELSSEYIAKQLAILKNDITRIENKILEDHTQFRFAEKRALLPALLYATFPPTTAFTREAVYRLYKKREDRQQDVTQAFARHEKEVEKFSEVEVKTGTLTLSSGEELDLERWSELAHVIQEVHSQENSLQENTAEAGKKLVQWYLQPATFQRKELWKIMYTHEVLSGRKLSENPGSNPMELMKYKEFIGDRIKSDFVHEMLVSYQHDFPKDYNEFLGTVGKRIQLRNPQSIAKKLWSMRAQYIKTKDVALQQKFEGSWDTEYSLSAEEVIGTQDEAALTAILIERGTKDIEEEAARLVGVSLVKDTNTIMRKELDKFSFHEDANESTIPIHFTISKRKTHSVAGLNMGVCVANDEMLWETPEFMNVIAFDTNKKVAMGGMHFYFVNYEGKKYLSLPGINPSLELLTHANAREVYEKFLSFAKNVAKELDCHALWIPESEDIHSNRTQINNIVAAKKYQKIPLTQTIPFAYSPKKYDYNSVYEIAVEK